MRKAGKAKRRLAFRLRRIFHATLYEFQEDGEMLLLMVVLFEKIFVQQIFSKSNCINATLPPSGSIYRRGKGGIAKSFCRIRTFSS
jgi:hypothetical protein